MDQEQKRKNAPVVETVAKKFSRLDACGRAYVLGYLMGKEDERAARLNAEEAEEKEAPAPLAR